VTGDPARAALDARILAWMGEPWQRDDARFDATARAVFEHQFGHCEPYARFCRGRGITPDSLESWEQIPAVPAGAFKEMALRSFPASAECHVFRTSGTTGERRGELHLDTLALYEASLLPPFERFVLAGLGRTARILVLTPSPAEQPDSSLSHMFGVAVAARGDAASGFFVSGGALQIGPLLDALDRADAPVALCGTAFSFVHLLDALGERGVRLQLPAGSRVMETGGFKGRAREISRDELYTGIEARLGVASARIVNQYGMTELGSQFHDSVLALPGAPRRKLGPPWARARIVDPETGRTSAAGTVGALVFHDLANTGSVAAIQTADLGRPVGDGFEVLGREAGAEARGCSIALDAMLGAG
jgi:acyl-CoA synthetase (AMP-forming)/AMP-acid ligase II